MHRNKKILFVIPKLCNGGAERRVSILANSFCDRGYRVSLLSFYESDDDYYLNPNIKRLHLFKRYRHNKFIKDKFRIINLFFLFLFRRFDVIFTMHPPVSLMTHIACFYKRVNIVDLLEVSPNSIKDLNRRVKGWKKAKKIIVQCERQKQLMPPSLMEKCVVIYNPVTDDFLNVRHNYGSSITNILSVGRLDNEKNHELLLKAVRNIKDSGINFKLSIYGRGPLKNQLIELSKSYGLSDYVIFVDRSNKMTEVYNSSDLFVLTSNFEGMPNSLIEAMAVGLPCISTNCDTGPSDLIINNQNGLLVPVNNEKELTSSIMFLINNPEKAMKYGINAKESIKRNHNINKIIDQYEKVLRDIIDLKAAVKKRTK